MFSPAEEEGPFERAVRRERSRILRQALLSLSATQKRVLVLIYLDDMSLAEAGEILHVSKVAVWKTHQRALAILAAKLAELGLRQ